MATTNSILIEALTQIAGSNDSERIAEIARLAAQRILSSDAIALAQASGDVFWSHDPGQQKHTAQFRGTERLSLIGGPSKGSGEEWGYAGGAIAAPSAGHSGSSGHFQTEYPTPLMVEINAAKALARAGSVAIVRCVDLSQLFENNARLELERDDVCHRLKNAYTSAIGLAALSLPKEHSADFAQRLRTLVKVHELLDQGCPGSGPVHLGDLVAAVLSPYREGPEPRVVMSGPDTIINATTAAAFAMFANELATNALKHGALSVPSGRIAVEWTCGDGELGFWWREIGGPRIEDDPGQNQGSKLIRRIIERQLRGKMSQRLTPTGLFFSAVLPLT